jgi:hypothetical protein
MQENPSADVETCMAGIEDAHRSQGAADRSGPALIIIEALRLVQPSDVRFASRLGRE